MMRRVRTVQPNQSFFVQHSQERRCVKGTDMVIQSRHGAAKLFDTPRVIAAALSFIIARNRGNRAFVGRQSVGPATCAEDLL